MEQVDLIERVVKVEESAKSAHHRLNKVEENQEILMEMNSNIRVLAEQYKNQSTKIDKVEKDVEALKKIPAKRWESIIATVITVLVGAIVGAVITIVIK